MLFMSDSDWLYEFSRENGIFPPLFLPSEPLLPTEKFLGLGAHLFPTFFLGRIVGVPGFGIGLNQENFKGIAGAIPGVFTQGSIRILWKILVGENAHSHQSLDTAKGEFLGNVGGKSHSFLPSFPPKIRAQPVENPSGMWLGKTPNSDPNSCHRQRRIPQEFPWEKPRIPTQNPAPKGRESLGNPPGMPGWEMKRDKL